MPILKKYDQVNPSNVHRSFNIQRMEDIWEQHQGKADQPHRHEYYTIVLTQQAAGKHIVDFHEFELMDHQVYFVSPDQVHQIVENQRSQGYALTFTEQFLLENGIEACFIEDLHLFQHFGYAPPLNLDPLNIERLYEYSELMITSLNKVDAFTYAYIGSLLKIFLIDCNRFCTLSSEDHTQTKQGSTTLLRDFKSLLNQHFRTIHKVQEYAKLLHITPDHLNASLKKFTNKTAKEHIHAKLTVESKRLLKFSDKTTKEIAYELGFSEAANFSLFFKKQTAVSPTEFMKMP